MAQWITRDQQLDKYTANLLKETLIPICIKTQFAMVSYSDGSSLAIWKNYTFLTHKHTHIYSIYIFNWIYWMSRIQCTLMYGTMYFKGTTVVVPILFLFFGGWRYQTLYYQIWLPFDLQLLSIKMNIGCPDPEQLKYGPGSRYSNGLQPT